MLYAVSRLLYGGVQHNPPSRFLSEIDGEVSSSNQYEAIGSYTPLGQTQEQDNEPRYIPDLNEGDSVSHKVFGIGTVVELDGDNVVIYFKGKGSKKLDLSFAPIEKI
jgi:DNA helicase-2/ATP-dependent DNA helicase PcrA